MGESGKEQEMSFWDHLDELRGTIFRSLLAVCLLAVLGFVFKRALFAAVLAPASEDFFIYRLLGWRFDLELINVEMSAQFFVHLQAAFSAALILACPYIIWELWRFIAPALYKGERRAVGTAFLMATGLFYAGAAVGYLLVLPACVQFFLNYSVSELITNSITISSYMSMFTSTVLLVGVAFEFPTVIMVLSHLGLLGKDDLKRYRKYAFIVVLILSALITPSDPFSMFVLSIPLYGLYEFSILVCKPDTPSDDDLAE